MYNMQKKLAGFTLLELMVTMAIIGVLIGLALFGISAAQSAARDTSRKSAIQDINVGIQKLYSITNAYPGNIAFVNSPATAIISTTGITTIAGCSAAPSTCIAVGLKGAAVPSNTGTVNLTNGKLGVATSNQGTDYCFNYSGTGGYELGAILESAVFAYGGTATANTTCVNPTTP